MQSLLKLHIKESLGTPTHSFIFLHGYDCTGEENIDEASWSHNNTTAYRGLRVVCPDAFLLYTNAPGYKKTPVHSWYDFWDGECTSADDKPDLETLKKSCNEIHKIICREAEIVGDTTRVFLGGVSQGCCAAFHAASTFPNGKLGGFYGSIGHVLPCTDVSNLSDKILGPIVFFCGADDEVMSWNWTKETFMRLEHVQNVEIWREDAVCHEDDGHWIANFLLRVLPPPPLKDQMIAYKQLDYRSSLK